MVFPTKCLYTFSFNEHQISAVRWAAFNKLGKKASSVWYRLEKRKASSVCGTLSYIIPRLHSCSTSREAGEFKQHNFVLLTLIQTVLMITSSNSLFRFVLNALFDTVVEKWVWLHYVGVERDLQSI